MDRKQPDIRVVAAKLEDDGEIRDVIAVFPPDATALTPEPEAFSHDGELAIMTIQPGTPKRNVHEFTTDMMFIDAERRAGFSRTVSSVVLDHVVSLPTLTYITSQDIH